MASGLSRRSALGGGLALLVTPLYAGTPALGSPVRPRPESEQGPVRLGVLTDLAGPLAAHGKRQLLGIRHRAEQLNAAGGHGSGHGGAVELLVRDAGPDEKSAAAAASALLDEGVHAVIGTSAAWLGAGVLDQCNLGCTPVIVPAAGIVPAMPYAFQSAPAAGQVLSALMKAAMAGGAGKVAQLGLDKLLSPEMTELAANAASAQGLEIAGVERFPLDATDLKDAVGKAIAAKPDALVLAALPAQSGAAVKEARAAGFTGPILLAPEGVHPEFHTTAKEAAEGVQAVGPWLMIAGAAPDSVPDAVPNAPTVRRFAAGFVPENGPANPAAGFGADAVSLTHLAYLGHRDRKAAREQLEKMCCVGVCGVYNITADDHAGLAEDALLTATSKAGRWTAPPPGP
ncbi:MAG: ABC transporter substrate-binding protein [Hamadaea sp.]|nr:ABC transporter substrate-binding protein [Hamadaea sp.]